MIAEKLKKLLTGKRVFSQYQNKRGEIFPLSFIFLEKSIDKTAQKMYNKRVKESDLFMKYKFNEKEINIPDEEIKSLINNLDLTEQQAIETWLDDNDYTTNEEVEELTKKAKVNGTTKIKARANVENKKTTRERKENPAKVFIIQQILSKLAEIDTIYNLKVENKEKIISFEYENHKYKIDLVQRREKNIKND